MRATEHLIEDGRVSCPRLGDVDVDRCRDCPSFRKIVDKPYGRVVLCTAEAELSRQAFLKAMATSVR